MRRVLLSLLLLTLGLGASAQRLSLTDHPKCDAQTYAAVLKAMPADDKPAATAGEMRLLAKVTPDFDAEALRAMGIAVGAKAGDIVALRLPAGKVALLNSRAEVLQYCIAPVVAPNMDRTRRDTRTDSVHAGASPLPQAYTGDGVLIGITDWGFDYRHPNYNNRAGNQRLLRAWDQFKLASPAPAGFDYGTEYSSRQELLNAKSDTNNIYNIGTHGTHVAGIAAGRGVEGKYMGEAPDANLIFCTFRLDAASWMDAVAWMTGVAREEGKRLVVNSSWGMYTLGPIDGTSLLSQAINNWAQDSNVVFVTSGGNCGDDQFHVARTFVAGTADTLTTSPSYYAYTSATGQSVFLWGEPDKAFKARLGLYKGDSLHWSEWYNTADGDLYAEDSVAGIEGLGDLTYDVAIDQHHPDNRRPHIHFNIDKLRTQLCRVLLQYTADEGTVHAWNVVNLSNGAGNMGTTFTNAGNAAFTSGNNDCGIGEPACAERCISVAAHNPNDYPEEGPVSYGDIADFSSHGPLIDGRHKPDVSAPGVQVVSSINSRTTETGYAAVMSYFYQGVNYKWSRMSGTSMSGPAVTGICALLLQANPDLTPIQIRQILCQTAINDTMTGPLHLMDSISDIWGYGKVDAFAAVNEALSLVDIRTADEEWFAHSLQLYPNPATGRVTILTGRHTPEQVTIYTMDGRRVMQQTVTMEGTLDLQTLTQGLYIVRCGARTAKLIKR